MIWKPARNRQQGQVVTELYRQAAAVPCERLAVSEARSAQTDARGIVVIAGGVLLTGLAAQPALYWPAADAVVAVVLAGHGLGRRPDRPRPGRETAAG